MFTDTIQVLTYPTTTDRGRVVPDYTGTPTAVTITGCDVQPGVSPEMVATHRVGTDVVFTVYVPTDRVPAGVTLTAASVARYAGDRYQVQGRPEAWTGALGHYVILLSQWAAA